MNKDILNRIQIEERHLKMLNDILSKYPYQFYAYGSRTKGNAWKYSDLDICYKEDISINEISKIRENFVNSKLPFEIDLVNWKNMRPQFKESIKDELVLLT